MKIEKLKKNKIRIALQDIEDIVCLVMKTKMNSNFEYITMDNFINNFLSFPQLSNLLK